MPAPQVSIVVATYQRLGHLTRCLTRTRAALSVPYEFVVVDGGSRDGTPEWLAAQPDVRYYTERERSGCCRAYNIGLRMARGGLVMWLNDDSYALPGAVDAAARLLDSPAGAGIGQVAFYHTHQQPWNEIHGCDVQGVHYGVLHVRGHPYANFGMQRRTLLERLGYLDAGYYFCAWDPDLSLKVRNEAGLDVVAAPGALVFHEELLDERKQQDGGEIRTRDNQRLFRKWGLPDKGDFPDPRPAYLDVLRRYGLA